MERIDKSIGAVKCGAFDGWTDHTLMDRCGQVKKLSGTQ